ASDIRRTASCVRPLGALFSTMTEDRALDVLTAGGGISGLAAARDLVRRGRRVRLVEARARLGGLIATEKVEGFTIEAGPDSLLKTNTSAAALCGELGLTLVATLPPRTAFLPRTR